MFKTEYKQTATFDEPAGQPFRWLDGKPAHDHHMGLEREEFLQAELIRLEQECNALGLSLPPAFVLFMGNPTLHKSFRSINAGFFDLRKPPVKCPLSDGYLIPFISDQQYCHFYFLHLLPDSDEYDILWADDLYCGALYASPQDFESDYKDEFDPRELYLCNTDFERFLRCHFAEHEAWFAENTEACEALSCEEVCSGNLLEDTAEIADSDRHALASNDGGRKTRRPVVDALWICSAALLLMLALVYWL